jgi:beta-glucosidase
LLLAGVVIFAGLQARKWIPGPPGYLIEQGGRIAVLDERLEQTPNARLLFIGDSLTQEWEHAGRDVWAQNYAPRGAVNLGVWGDGTQNVLWRLQNAPLRRIDPDVAIVLIGTNDAKTQSPEAIAQGIAAIVQELRTRLPRTRILLLAIFPRDDRPLRETIARINQLIEPLADGKNVFVLDIGDRFLSADGTISRAIMPDLVHLSPRGYQTWAEAMEPTLTGLMAGNSKPTHQ